MFSRSIQRFLAERQLATGKLSVFNNILTYKD